MLKNKSKQQVSWREAYRVGFSIAVNYKVFTWIALFSILCERYISFYLYFTNISLAKVFNQYKEMIVSMARDPLGNCWHINQFKELVSFIPIALVFFLIGAFFLIGILGLMRDLLVKQDFRTKEIFQRGRIYFWPVFRFKLPIYFVLGFIIIALASPLIKRDPPFKFSFPTLAVILIVGCMFFFTRVFLSFGPKIIVTEELKKILPLYKRIAALIYPSIKQVLIFYAWMFLMVGFSLALPIALKLMGVSFAPLMIISLSFIAFFTVVMKASSFCFYLQLRSIKIDPGLNKLSRFLNKHS